MRDETHLDHIATIIQTGHIEKLTSEEVAFKVMQYMAKNYDLSRESTVEV
jgi:hypothetical protein